MSIDLLLNTYYEGLDRRRGWEQPLADDFVFTAPSGSATGKAAYAETVHRFQRVFETASVKQSIANRHTACAIVTYAVVSPSGRTMSIDIAEVWTADENRLTSLTIYYDTARWNAFMAS
jgi:ketosteroid isomerase-like protein